MSEMSADVPRYPTLVGGTAEKSPFQVTLDVENLGRVHFSAVDGRETLGNLSVPRALLVEIPQDSASPDLQLLLYMDDGVATVREVHVVAKESQRGVASSDLRAIRLSNWIEDLFAAVGEKAYEMVPGDYPITWPPPTGGEIISTMRKARRRGAHRKITAEFLSGVAKVHREAKRAPTQAVADHCGVAHRTASLYISMAKEIGLIDDTRKGDS